MLIVLRKLFHPSVFFCADKNKQKNTVYYSNLAEILLICYWQRITGRIPDKPE